jgi:hypothetical protein
MFVCVCVDVWGVVFGKRMPPVLHVRGARPYNARSSCTEVTRVVEKKNIVWDRQTEGWGRRRSVETRGGGGAFVALRHAAKTSPQRHAPTTGARVWGASVTTLGTATHTHTHTHTHKTNSLSLFFTPSSSSSSFTLPSPIIPELCRI